MSEHPPLTRRIGGSDLPKLLGLSKYGDELDVYDRIVNGVEAEWNEPMLRGMAFEQVLRAHGQRALGLVLEDSESDYHAHPTLEFAGAQVDDLIRYQGIPALCDYKTVNRYAKGWGPPGSNIVPEHIVAQVQWELLCADRQLALVVAGFGEDRPAPEMFILSNVITYELERDEDFLGFAVSIARYFWERHALRRVPPTPSRRKKKAS